MPRIGIIGAGSMARQHATSYARIAGAEIAGFADADAERATALARQFGGRPYASTQALLEAERPNVADVCSITPRHADDAMACLASRVPVIVEKPLARHLDDARRVVDAFQEAGIPMLPAHVVRYFPDFYHARAQVQAGAVGRPAVVRVTRGGPFPRGRGNWYADPAHSGGVLIDLMLHDFDWLRWCFGEVERVTASSLMAQGARGKDYGLAVLRFRSGVIAHVEGTWAHSDGFRVALEVSGDLGVLEYSSQSPSAFRLRQDTTGSAASVAVPESPVLIDPYTAQLSELLLAATGQGEARVSAQDALAALEIGEACWQSATSGQPVAMPPA